MNIQRIVKYCCRTIKQLKKLPYVNSIFQETLKNHHTFNLVLFKNNIVVNNNNIKLFHSLISLCSKTTLLEWVVHEALLINEHDQGQQQVLKSLLRRTTRYGEHSLIILLQKFYNRETLKTPASSNVDAISAMTSILHHFFDTCRRLDVTQSLMYSGYLDDFDNRAKNVLIHSVGGNRMSYVPPEILKIVFSSLKEGWEGESKNRFREALVETCGQGFDVLSYAIFHNINAEALKFILQTFREEDMFNSSASFSVSPARCSLLVMNGVHHDLDIESMKVLLSTFAELKVEMFETAKDLSRCLNELLFRFRDEECASTIMMTKLKLLIQYSSAGDDSTAFQQAVKQIDFEKFVPKNEREHLFVKELESNPIEFW